MGFDGVDIMFVRKIFCFAVGKKEVLENEGSGGRWWRYWCRGGSIDSAWAKVHGEEEWSGGG